MNSSALKKLEISRELEELGEAELELVQALVKALLAKIGKPAQGALPPSERGKRMAEILEQGAKLGLFKDIQDPAAWQREIRRDRPLPGRE
jgi:hypothetical protein